jgi:hypothetical protein
VFLPNYSSEYKYVMVFEGSRRFISSSIFASSIREAICWADVERVPIVVVTETGERVE